jgi:mycothiol system anti-sigma-R factor
MTCSEYLDLVAADVDGELTAAERADVEAHVASCARCTELRRAQTEVRALVRTRATRHAAPAFVRDRIAAELRRQPAAKSPAAPPARRWRIVIGGAIAASLLFALASLLRPSPPDVVAVLAKDVHHADRNEMALGLETENVDELRRFYRGRVDVPPEQSVEDLTTVGFRIVGGREGSIDGARTTVTLYEGGAGKVICRRFREAEVELPKDGEMIGGMQVFSSEGMTARLARLPNGVVCAMASSMPREEFLDRFVRR